MINIVIAINSRYTRYAYVMLTSLFLNNRQSDITVYVLQSDLTDENKNCLAELASTCGQHIEYIDVDITPYLKRLPTSKIWTKEIYYRLLVGELLPKSLERLLYLDVDVIVHQSIEAFYEMDMQGMELAATDDAMIQGNFSAEQTALFADLGEDIRYFNSGMLLYDLKRIRENYSFANYCEAARRVDYKLTYPDQDLLNYVHCGKVLFVDNNRYNAFSQNVVLSNETLNSLVIVHYAGRKPWSSNDTRYEMERLWWLYAKETPFYVEMMEEVFWNSFSDTSHQIIRTLRQENMELKKSLQKAMEVCQKLYDKI